MNISFLKILTKPLGIKNILTLILNLFLLFLPALLSANFFGIDNLLFKITLSLALIVTNGYLWTIFQNEVEDENDDLPKWHYVNDFFIGLRGVIFSLACIILLAAVLAALWFLVQYVPDSKNIAIIIAIIYFIYWLLMFNAIAMGIFSENFNPIEALNFSTITEVIIGCWLNYLIACFYMIAYIFIIGMACWACIGLNFSNPVFGVFIAYAIIVYFSLYAKVFKCVRTEYESHI